MADLPDQQPDIPAIEKDQCRLAGYQYIGRLDGTHWLMRIVATVVAGSTLARVRDGTDAAICALPASLLPVKSLVLRHKLIEGLHAGHLIGQVVWLPQCEAKWNNHSIFTQRLRLNNTSPLCSESGRDS